MATVSLPIEVVRRQDREKTRLAGLGLCAPCAYALSRAGFTGNRSDLCPECEGKAIGLGSD